MADSLFDIFGDHLTRQTVKNVSRQPLSNIENMGKTVMTGPIKPNTGPIKPNTGPIKPNAAPIKPNEPMKKGETKKSFLANAGKALQSTPMRKVFTPSSINLGSLIYNDDTENKSKGFNFEEIEFTKPTFKYDNYKDLLDLIPTPNTQTIQEVSPPNTPPPAIRKYSMEFDCSYQDEFFTDDFSNESIPEDDLGLPDIC